MLVLEYKAKCNQSQKQAINEVLRTTQFIRNKAIRYWMDSPKEAKINRIALNNYSTALRKEFSFVEKLNSMACQSATVRVACRRHKSMASNPKVLRQLQKESRR